MRLLWCGAWHDQRAGMPAAASPRAGERRARSAGAPAAVGLRVGAPCSQREHLALVCAVLGVLVCLLPWAFAMVRAVVGGLARLAAMSRRTGARRTWRADAPSAVDPCSGARPARLAGALGAVSRRTGARCASARCWFASSC